MKQLKLAVLAMFTLVTVSNVAAQDSNNPWAISIGVNTVDIKSFSQKIEDYYGMDDWNTFPMLSRITAEKY